MNGSNSPMLDADKIAAELSARGMAWADANAAAEALEETKPTVLAQLAAEQIGTGKSAAAADTMAKADDRYLEHIQKMVDARKAANRARIRWDTYKAYVELLRTNASTDRAMMTMR